MYMHIVIIFRTAALAGVLIDSKRSLPTSRQRMSPFSVHYDRVSLLITPCLVKVIHKRAILQSISQYFHNVYRLPITHICVIAIFGFWSRQQYHTPDLMSISQFLDSKLMMSSL